MDPESLYPIVKDRPRAKYSEPSEPASGAAVIPTPANPTHKRNQTEMSQKTLVGRSSTEKDDEKALTEEEEDLQDALSPLYDQLKVGNKAWWILEILPLTQRYQRDDNDEWVEEPVYVQLHRPGRIVD